MSDETLRRHLIAALTEKNAHVMFDGVVADFPVEIAGVTVDGSPHTAWQLLEHLRIAQWDVLEFSRDPKHVSPDWPEGY